MDIRLKNLSYSSNLLLHTCPRKYQLYKLGATFEADDSSEESITFAYGHVVGLGIQLVLQELSEEDIIWQMFINWKPDLFAVNAKQQKSFWSAVGAIQTFISLRNNGFLKDWELVYYNGKPAVELGFCINLPDGFKYRGFVDAVLRNKVTGKILVLECKTTSSTNLSPAMYKNSAQAIGYSIVLDHLFSELSSYEVLYLVYLTKSYRYEPMQFPKSYLQRALWLQELLLEVEKIKLYESTGVYPMHGESCYEYYRECNHMQTCTLSTALITTPLTPEIVAKIEAENAKYDIIVDFEQLILTQLGKEIEHETS